MPTPCQQDAHPYNTWDAGHDSYAGGKMDGFVKSQSGPVAMGYYDQTVMPFVNSLATTFPVCDQYFSSVMAQTYPNRRYFMAGTSLGLITDTLNEDKPPNGTIFEALNTTASRGRTTTRQPSVSYLIWTYLANDPAVTANAVNISEFFTDAAAGTLPAFSLVDPNFGTQSEENPQDVQFGDQFLSQVVNAVMSSPQWPNTLLVWTYDEGGGYYDHVPPPKAVKPDAVPPALAPTDPPWITCSTATDSGFRPEWCRRSPGLTTCRVWSTTTPRSSSSSRPSGTCPRSPTATPTPTTFWTASTW
jgi:phospholipase C